MLRFGLPPRVSIPALLALSLLALAVPRPVGAVISTMRVVPTVFSPNGDGVKDHAVITWTITGTAAIELRLTIGISSPPGSFVARRTSLGSRPLGLDSLVWDGTDSLGVLAPDGLYAIQLDQLDAGGTVVANAQVAVRLDASVPPLPTMSNTDMTVTVAAFAVHGTAAAADTVILYRDGLRVDSTATAATTFDYSFPLVLAEGDNNFSVQSFDAAGNLSPQSPSVDIFYLNTPDIGVPKAIPAFFSPNGDGVADTTHAQFTLDAPTTQLRVAVRRGVAPVGSAADLTQPVSVIYDAPSAAGSYSIAWDGRDSVGTLATDGLYVFAVKAESLSAASTPIPSTITRYAGFRLDNTPPPAPTLVPPPPAHTIRSSLPLTIEAAETDSVRIDRGGVLLLSVPVGVASGTATLHVTIPLVLGDNVITLRAVDFSGNLSAIAGPYPVQYEAPIGFHAPERFAAGDAFDVNLNSAARSVVIDLFTLRGELVRQLVSSSSLTRYEIQWDLKDHAGQFVGDGPYLARLRVTYPDGSGSESKAAVVVVK